MSIQIICACKNLVEVIDRKIAAHDDASGEPCMASGMRYISRKISPRSPGDIGVEVVGVKEQHCGNCGNEHGVALVKVTSPKANWN
jgi:hypothetical protein